MSEATPLRGLHVHALGDGKWGVFTPVAGNDPVMVAKCGGPDAEQHARQFAETVNACDRLGVEPGELEATVGRLVEAGNRAAELLEAFHPDTGDGCLVEADTAALRTALADWEGKRP